MFRLRRDEQSRQADLEVERATALLTALFGLSTDAATAALKDEAATTGVSVHAAALAVVANCATRSPVVSRVPSRR